MTQFSVPALGLAAALILSAQGALTQSVLAQDAAQDAGSEDPVVARVNGKEILRSEVEETANQLPPQYRQQLDAIFPMLLQRTIDLQLLASAAEASDVSSGDEFKKRLEEIRVSVMRDVFLEQQVAERVNDELLNQRYQEFLEANPPQPEIRARHILVKADEEDKAKDLIKQLDEGADFAQLAKENSIGPSAIQGGDLSYFTQEQMVPEFSLAAFALETGSHSKEPVKTEFGWHVIQVVDRREVAPPSFEEMEQELYDELSQQAVETILEDLRNGAEVEIMEAKTEAGAEDKDAAPKTDQ